MKIIILHNTNDILSPMRRGRFWAGLLLGIVLTLSIQSLYLIFFEEMKNFAYTVPQFFFWKNNQGTTVFIKHDKQDIDTIKHESTPPPMKIVDTAFYWAKWKELIAKPEYREMDSLFIDSLIKAMYVQEYQKKKADSTQILKEVLIDKFIVEVPTLLGDPKNEIDTTFRVTKNPVNQFVYIELWNSPFKVNGYLYTPPVLQLYGYRKDQIQKVFYYENGLLVKIHEKWFLIEPTQKFRRLDISFTSEWLKKI